MKHDSHFHCYRIHCAKQSLGTRYVPHKNHSGGISHNPSEVNVLKTIRRANRIRRQQAAAKPVSNVATLKKAVG